MKTLFFLAGVILLVTVSLPSCAQEQALPPAPVSNTEADLETVKAIPEQWAAAYHANNLEAVVQLYTQDAARIPPNEENQEGKEAIRNHLESEFAEYTSEGEIVVIDAKVSGDLGFARGIYKGTSTSSTGGDSIEYDNKFVVVFQRQADGSWKTIIEIWNDNPPSE